MLFCPAYTGPLASRGPMVVANHGIYESIPGEFSLWARLRSTPLYRATGKRADRVIANSQPTKVDLIKHFGIADERIDVVYPAAHDIFFETHPKDEIEREVSQALGSSVPYILFVGN